MHNSTTEDVATKICSQCGEAKPATREFFYPRKDGRGGGYANPCKECQRLQRQKGERFTDFKWQSAEIDLEQHLRKCTICLAWLPANQDYFSIGTGSPDGCYAKCKSCYQSEQNNMYATDDEFRKQRREQSLTYHFAHRDDPDYQHRRWCQWLKTGYNLTEEQFFCMLDNQGWICAIDGCSRAHTPDRPLNVDHDHSCCSGNRSCGQCVRGLICGSCNSALGYSKDSPAVLLGLIEYLEAWQTKAGG